MNFYQHDYHLVHAFRPKNKFIRITKDENFSSDLHYLSNTPAMAKASCSYDLDPVDEAWLNILNGERTMTGNLAVTEEQFERVIEELEVNKITKDFSFIYLLNYLLG